MAGNRKDRRREKSLRRRGKGTEQPASTVTPVAMFGFEEGATGVNVIFDGGSIVYPAGTGHPLAGAKITGRPGGGFRIAEAGAAPALVFQPVPHTGSIYLYLGKESFADTWVNGGSIPLSPAAEYRSDRRQGVMTPDEVRQFDENLNDPEAFKVIKDHAINTTGVRAGQFDNLQIQLADGTIRNISGTVDDYEEDAYLFCAAYELSSDLMERLENKVCVVEIEDPAQLKTVLDGLMSQVSFGGRVDYTDGPKRGHFLKSTEDDWQAEYRLAWIKKGSDLIWVNIPAGLAKRVTAPQVGLSFV